MIFVNMGEFIVAAFCTIYAILKVDKFLVPVLQILPMINLCQKNTT